jgi:hypothetical protein
MAIYDEEADQYERISNMIVMGISLLIIVATFVGVVGEKSDDYKPQAPTGFRP